MLVILCLWRERVLQRNYFQWSLQLQLLTVQLISCVNEYKIDYRLDKLIISWCISALLLFLTNRITDIKIGWRRTELTIPRMTATMRTMSRVRNIVRENGENSEVSSMFVWCSNDEFSCIFYSTCTRVSMKMVCMRYTQYWAEQPCSVFSFKEGLNGRQNSFCWPSCVIHCRVIHLMFLTSWVSISP